MNDISCPTSTIIDVGIGELILILRRRKSYSVDGLAKMSGISPALLSRIENGSYKFSLETIHKILEQLDYPRTVEHFSRIERERDERRLNDPENKRL